MNKTIISLAAAAAMPLLSAESKSPNIVLIMADDMGYECIGANGGTSYKTPNIDKLASQGVRFVNCQAQALCTPSRVKIMTGQSNIVNYTKFGSLRRDARTFGNAFRDAGYKTCIIGKWQLGDEKDSPVHFGFDEAFLWQHRKPRQVNKSDTRYTCPQLELTKRTSDGKIVYDAKRYMGKYSSDLLTDYACDFLDRNRKQPFLLYYPMVLVHCPFSPAPGTKAYDPDSLGSKTYKGNPKYFKSMVEYTDKCVGRIMNKLDALGLRENTIVIFTGDNGTDKPIVSMMGSKKVIGSKGKTIEWGTHVPFIASCPGAIPAGKVNNDLIDFSDVFPTICDAAQVKSGVDSMTGKTFFPQLKGQEGNPRKWLYCWYNRSGKKGEEKVFARNLRYKLYSNGNFFDVIDDIQEKHAVKEGKMNKEMLKVRDDLKQVIKDFSSYRK